MSALLAGVLLLQAVTPETHAADLVISQYAKRTECVVDLGEVLPRGRSVARWQPLDGIALRREDRVAIATDYMVLKQRPLPSTVQPFVFGPLPPKMRQISRDQETVCASILSLYRPERSGATIFVGANYFCGDLCAGGVVWALRQHEGQWRIVASEMEWVS